jgi:ubiquinone/menaquinone biosynthesis C-methylase UbiE
VSEDKLTDRQKAELEYHRDHAKKHEQLLDEPILYELVDDEKRRWWNQAWAMYTFLRKEDLKGKKTLIVGCGFAKDPIFMAKLGSDVYAFDLSPEELSIARKLAEREGYKIDFKEMPAEKMTYPDDTFDCILARDILHHVDVPETMREIVRVAKDGALLIVNEIYSHSFIEKIRHWAVIDKYLYPAMRKFIYKGKEPYITPDERKLSEHDMALITAPIEKFELKMYFDFMTNRLFPDRYRFLNKVDTFLLNMLKPIAPILAGRVLIAGRISKR